MSEHDDDASLSADPAGSDSTRHTFQAPIHELLARDSAAPEALEDVTREVDLATRQKVLARAALGSESLPDFAAPEAGSEADAPNPAARVEPDVATCQMTETELAEMFEARDAQDPERATPRQPPEESEALAESSTGRMPAEALGELLEGEAEQRSTVSYSSHQVLEATASRPISSRAAPGAGSDEEAGQRSTVQFDSGQILQAAAELTDDPEAGQRSTAPLEGAPIAARVHSTFSRGETAREAGASSTRAHPPVETVPYEDSERLRAMSDPSQVPDPDEDSEEVIMSARSSSSASEPEGAPAPDFGAQPVETSPSSRPQPGVLVPMNLPVPCVGIPASSSRPPEHMMSQEQTRTAKMTTYQIKLARVASERLEEPAPCLGRSAASKRAEELVVQMGVSANPEDFADEDVIELRRIRGVHKPRARARSRALGATSREQASSTRVTPGPSRELTSAEGAQGGWMLRVAWMLLCVTLGAFAMLVLQHLGWI